MAYSTEDLRDLIIELDKKIDRVVSSMDYIKAKQDETNLDLARIKDPDSGLFSRIKTLESWKETHSKITWGAISAVTFLIVKQLWDVIT